MTSSARLIQQKLLLRTLTRKKGLKGLAQGFTLIELMIVIVIVGILSAVALPNYLNQASKAKATECTTKLGAMLSQIGAEALTSATAATTLRSTLVTEGNASSSLCTFAAGTGDAGSTLTMTATGKSGSDLATKYSANGCINYSNMKRDIQISNSSAAAPTASCPNNT